ncbi:Inorganic pyrophosphatase like protein [Aduncisulcus paluster]|nr:Inorganic pyrophosphatase like protein [Aduncisulcus paluster]GKT36347.1 Inorganic pyrophosphatase like protein [Aduncisulcus paluster]
MSGDFRGYKGDDDPLDIFDIAPKSHSERHIGDMYPVVVLGAIPFVDRGEADFKLLSAPLSFPPVASGDLETLASLKRMDPSLIPKLKQWLTSYKKSQYGDSYGSFSGQDLDEKEALQLIKDTLISKGTGKRK